MNRTIRTLHPESKARVNINRAKYDRIKIAILQALETSGPMIFTELSGDLSRRLRATFEGSINWYTVAVRFDLEARELIERIPDTRPSQLRLADGRGPDTKSVFAAHAALRAKKEKS